MKIVSCYTSLEEIAPLMEAGADELYTSVRGTPSFSAFALKGSAAAAFKKIHAAAGKALIALNSLAPVLDQKETLSLLKLIDRLEDQGADAFIAASPSILSLLAGRRQPRAAVHLSSVQPCFNSSALSFFLRFGIKRVIFPGQLLPSEAEKLLALCRRSGVETETFDYRFFGCLYVNGRCGLHTPVFYLPSLTAGTPPCQSRPAAGELLLSPQGRNPARGAEIPAISRRVWERLAGKNAPRISNQAAFFDFFASGVQYLKYGVRSAPTEAKVRAVRAMKESCDLAGELIKTLGRKEAGREFVRRATRGGCNR